MAATYEPIATTTLGSGTSSYTFSSIPSTYTDLVVVCNVKATASGQWIALRFNSDSGSNYSDTVLEGYSTSSYSSNREANMNRVQIVYQGGTDTNFGLVEYNVQNYSNATTYKTILGRHTYAGNSTTAGVSTWRSTSAISSVTIVCSGTMDTGSMLTVYGIKAA